MNIIRMLKSRLTYREVAPLAYSEGLRAAYSGLSISGGSLKGKNVVVTGASSGIGLAISRRYLQEGCKVIITGRNEEKLRKAAFSLKGHWEGVAYHVMDNLDAGQLAEAVPAILKDRDVDIWVNCAGIFTKSDSSRRFREVDNGTYQKVLDTNFKSTYIICETVANYFENLHRKGLIINIASICGLFPSYGYTPYGISKSAVIAMTRELAEKHKGTVDFQCVSPGSVATVMSNKKIGDDISNPGTMVTHHTAMPEEVASLVVFLSSDAGRLCDNLRNRGGIVCSASEIF